jgi:hypothetical protein
VTPRPDSSIHRSEDSEDDSHHDQDQPDGPQDSDAEDEAEEQKDQAENDHEDLRTQAGDEPNAASARLGDRTDAERLCTAHVSGIHPNEGVHMLYRLFNAFIGRESGTRCRSCGDVVVPGDEFGVSEGVCRNCRG